MRNLLAGCGHTLTTVPNTISSPPTHIHIVNGLMYIVKVALLPSLCQPLSITYTSSAGVMRSPTLARGLVRRLVIDVTAGEYRSQLPSSRRVEHQEIGSYLGVVAPLLRFKRRILECVA